VSALACARCGARITDDEARIEVCGLHRHTARNPGGYEYVVCCFAAAGNVRVVTNESSEWSWFPGWRWQVEHCEGCDEQLGWRYVQKDGSFHGFVEERLVAARDE